jgi:uncharacterized protein (UPF0261 family)
VAVVLPGRGVSAIDRDGQPFDDPAARRVLHDAIRSGLAGRDVDVEELDLHINDPEFAETAAQRLIALIKSEGKIKSQVRRQEAKGDKEQHGL